MNTKDQVTKNNPINSTFLLKNITARFFLLLPACFCMPAIWLADGSVAAWKVEKFSTFDLGHGTDRTDGPTMHFESVPCKVNEIRQRTHVVWMTFNCSWRAGSCLTWLPPPWMCVWMVVSCFGWNCLLSALNVNLLLVNPDRPHSGSVSDGNTTTSWLVSDELCSNTSWYG